MDPEEAAVANALHTVVQRIPWHAAQRQHGTCAPDLGWIHRPV
ncbi:hypothetical protein [Streptomyces umbrinus]